MQNRTNNHRRGARAPRPVVPLTAEQARLYRAFAQWGADERRWRPATRRSYVGVIRRCDVWLRANGHGPIEAASADQLRLFLWTTPDTAPSRAMAAKTLRIFGTFLLDTGRREDNPGATMPRFRVRQGVPKSIERDEAQALLRAARAEGLVWHSLVMVLLFTGLRRAEAVAVRWQDIEGRWLRVPDGKGGKERMIPLHPRAWAALQASGT